jgi:hypothetical protein
MLSGVLLFQVFMSATRTRLHSSYLKVITIKEGFEMEYECVSLHQQGFPIGKLWNWAVCSSE